jgi:hypothetical protein
VATAIERRVTWAPAMKDVELVQLLTLAAGHVIPVTGS